MDSFAENSKKSFHIRSNSLPSKPHPIVDEVDQHLCRLKSSEPTSSLSQKLDGLQDLHDSIDKLLLLPLTHQALVDNQSVDDLLERSLELLDVCALAKDVLSQMKECAHELESALRRRRGDDVVVDVQKYLNSRKMMKKTIHKAMNGMERISFQKSDESSEIVSLLKEAEAVTYNSIESLLSFLAGPKSSSKMSRWSLVSKLMKPKRVANKEDETNSLVSKLMKPKRVANKEDETNGSEVEMVDATLCSITSHKSDFLLKVQDVQSPLRKLESCILDLEEDLESLYRHLIKNRVSLLNILNQ